MNESAPLTAVQQTVVAALANGSTVTAAAEAAHINRVTVYRWMKTIPQFNAALDRGRADFLIARRDDIFHLANRALETLYAVLNNPKSSPAVLVKSAMFILQRTQTPAKAWTMPEPALAPEEKELLDSVLPEDAEPEPEPDAAPEACNEMKHDSENSADVTSGAPEPGLRSCPLPRAPDVEIEDQPTSIDEYLRRNRAIWADIPA